MKLMYILMRYRQIFIISLIKLNQNFIMSNQIGYFELVEGLNHYAKCFFDSLSKKLNQMV